MHRKNHLLKYEHSFFAVVYKNVVYIKFVKIIGHLNMTVLAIIILFRQSFQKIIKQNCKDKIIYIQLDLFWTQIHIHFSSANHSILMNC